MIQYRLEVVHLEDLQNIFYETSCRNMGRFVVK